MIYVKNIEEFAQPLTYYTDGKRHLVCKPYSIENLHRMADELGIKRGWYHAGNKPHYDIPLKMKAKIEAKCEMVSPKDILQIIQDGLKTQ